VEGIRCFCLRFDWPNTFSASYEIPSTFELRMNKERERFYLLPGMGGSALRRKRKTILQWSIAAGLCISAAVAALLYFLYERR